MKAIQTNENNIEIRMKKIDTLTLRERDTQTHWHVLKSSNGLSITCLGLALTQCEGEQRERWMGKYLVRVNLVPTSWVSMTAIRGYWGKLLLQAPLWTWEVSPESYVRAEKMRKTPGELPRESEWLKLDFADPEGERGILKLDFGTLKGRSEAFWNWNFGSWESECMFLNWFCEADATCSIYCWVPWS